MEISLPIVIALLLIAGGLGFAAAKFATQGSAAPKPLPAGTPVTPKQGPSAPAPVTPPTDTPVANANTPASAPADTPAADMPVPVKSLANRLAMPDKPNLDVDDPMSEHFEEDEEEDATMIRFDLFEDDTDHG